MENKMERILSITAKDIQNINKLIKLDNDGRIRKIISQFASSEEEEEVLVLKTALLLEFGTPIFTETLTKVKASTENLTEKRPDWATEKDILQDGHVCVKQSIDGAAWIFSLVALRKRTQKQLAPTIIYGSLLKKTGDSYIVPSKSHNTCGIGYWSKDVRTATTEEMELFYKTFPEEEARTIARVYSRKPTVESK